jgi:putative ABC transport system permease protein
MFKRKPGFFVIAMLTIALGIGANTTIFGLVHGVLLRALPYPQGDRLVTLVESDRHAINPTNIAYGTFADWQEQITSFSSMAAVNGWAPVWDGGGGPMRLRGMRVSSGFFRTLGISPSPGRDFSPDEDRPDAARSVILTYGFWQAHLAGNPAAIGRTLRLSDSTYTIVGILPRRFNLLLLSLGSEEPDLYAPLGYDRSTPGACRTCQHLRGVARLAPGVTLSQARAEMSGMQSRLIRDYPNDYPPDAESMVLPFGEALTGRFHGALYLLFGAVVLLMLIACANIAGLLLTRGVGRRQEFAVRAALGAGSGRIVSQLLTESLMLGMAGGAAGVLLALWGIHLLVIFGPRDMPRLAEVGVGGAEVWFAAALSVGATVLFGLAPALQIAGGRLHDILKDGARGTEARSSQRLRGALVAAEVAISMTLLIGSGLLIRSVARLLAVNPGFDPNGVLTMSVSAFGDRYKRPEAAIQLYRQALDRVRSLPGVEGAAIGDPLPISGGYDRRGFHIQDRPLENTTEAPDADRYVISPGYLDLMRIALLGGRDFTEQDTIDSMPVALINETTARLQWPGADPIGKRIQLGGRVETDPWITIVGIVGDVRHYSLEAEPKMQVYVAHAQQGDTGMSLLIRGGGNMALGAARQAIASVDSGIPVYDARPLGSLVSESWAERRFTLGVLSTFAILAMILALVGVYGVISYGVESRRREIGIRQALGAGRRNVVWLVLERSLQLILSGTAAGLIAGMMLSRFLVSLLFEVKPFDVTTIGVSTLVLVAAGIMASYVPAWRAARVDPITALRCE